MASLGAGAPDAALRPTSDRVREALFNLLEHGDYPPLDGGRALDLFAGAGALGIEALSRGAERAVLIDDHPTARGLIRENLETCGLVGVAKLFRRDATRLGPNRGAPFTHLFLDPPYAQSTGLATRALASAQAGGWVAPEAVAIVEAPAQAEPIEAPGFTQADERRYGDSRLVFLRARA